MKNIVIASVLFCGLVGCDSAIFDNKIRKELRSRLKDPDSAKFSKELRLENRACIEYNAKNAYGGYAGVTGAHLVDKYRIDIWRVEEEEGTCSQEELERRIAADQRLAKEQDEITNAVLEHLKSKNIIPKEVSSFSDISNIECREFASSVAASGRLSLENQGHMRRSYDRDYWDGLKKIDDGICKK